MTGRCSSNSPDCIVQFLRDPALQDVEVRFSHYGEQAFQKHTHDSYSIGVVKRGRSRFVHCTPDERVYEIGAQELSLINPGEVHACNPLEGSVLTYYMLHLKPRLVNQAAAEVSGEISGEAGGAFLFGAPVVRDAALYRNLLDLCAALFAREDRLEMETRLYEVLAEMITRYGTRRSAAVPAGGTSELVRKGHQYLMDELLNNVSLEALAEASGMSKYAFLRAFREQYGAPPHVYQLQQRINHARELLAAGRPIAEVALESGFADQSHFTRKFKAFVGATPRQYQAGH